MLASVWDDTCSMAGDPCVPFLFCIGFARMTPKGVPMDPNSPGFPLRRGHMRNVILSITAMAIVAILVGSIAICMSLPTTSTSKTAITLLDAKGVDSIGVVAAKFDPEVTTSSLAYVNAERQREVVEVVSDYLSQYPVQKVIARQLTEIGNTETDIRFSFLENEGPESPEQKCDYAPLGAQGVAEILEIAVLELRFVRFKRGSSYVMNGIFHAEPAHGNTLTPCVRLRFRLVSLQHSVEMHSGELAYCLQPFPIKTSSSDPTLEHFENALRELSETLIDRLFLMDEMLVDLPFELGSAYSFD